MENNADVRKDTPNHHNEIRQVRTEKVVNVWGSVAGAGSDFFHLYRNHRNTEMNRLQEMDEEEEERIANDELQQTRERRATIEANKTAKRAAKRKRKAVAKSNVKSAKALNKFKNDGSFCTALLATPISDDTAAASIAISAAIQQPSLTPTTPPAAVVGVAVPTTSASNTSTVPPAAVEAVPTTSASNTSTVQSSLLAMYTAAIPSSGDVNVPKYNVVMMDDF